MKNDISISEILKCANPSQKILWAYIYSLLGERIAIQHFYYSGSLSSAPFNTFVPRTAWLAYEIEGSGVVAFVNYCMLRFYDLSNISMYSVNNSMRPDATDDFYPNDAKEQNILFGRAGAQGYTLTKMIGFKINY